MTKFALLSYSSNNLGDEIQSIAARQFLPSTDLLVDRDDWKTVPADVDGTFKIILNGWFTHNPEQWPPPAFLRPLLISMHITRERFKPTTLVAASDKLIEGASRAYLERHQPVGGRDTWTTSLLAQHGVQSYFSGCVTLTLGTGVRHPSQDYVCAVDLDEELFGSLTLRTRTPILRLRHSDPSGGTFEERCGRAAKLLSTYAHAKAVVTSRLHCALPCIAFGTPVLFIAVAPDAYRFSGLTELIRGCDAQAFKQGNVAFDADNPSANADRHLELRNRLVARLEAFTGTRMRPFQPQGPSELFSSA